MTTGPVLHRRSLPVLRLRARRRSRRARARRRRWCGSSRSRASGRPCRRSSPAPPRSGRHPGALRTSRAFRAFIASRSPPEPRWRKGTIESGGGPHSGSRESWRDDEVVEQPCLAEVVLDRVAERLSTVGPEGEPQLQRPERPRILERDVDHVARALVRDVRLLVRERLDEVAATPHEQDAARLREIEPLVGVERDRVGSVETGEPVSRPRAWWRRAGRRRRPRGARRLRRRTRRRARRSGRRRRSASCLRLRRRRPASGRRRDRR